MVTRYIDNMNNNQLHGYKVGNMNNNQLHGYKVSDLQVVGSPVEEKRVIGYTT